MTMTASDRTVDVTGETGLTDRQLRSERPAIRASSLAAQVYEELRRRITEVRLEEQEPLVIASLVRELGISHTPVREALARLHAEGLATFTDNIGYRVAPRPTSADYRDWMQARLVLEVGAMKTSLETPSHADLDQLRSINQHIKTADFGATFESVRLFSDLNRDFHRHLITMCANPFLSKAYDQIWLGAQFSRVHYEKGVLDQAKIAREHDDIIAALASDDIATAAEKLGSHIVNSLNRDASRQK
jgi:DNA-binding GntR family transcriptional regulator